MNQRSKRELLEPFGLGTRGSKKSGKTRILDEFVAATGNHRKYAIRVLKHGWKVSRLRKEDGGRSTRAK